MSDTSPTAAAGWPRQPLVYEINTRVWVRELSARAGRRITLDMVPIDELDRLAAMRLDAVWLMGVWTTGLEPIRLARTDEKLRREYRRTLPDFTEGDVIGSPYAVSRYVVAGDLGGPVALASLRARLLHHGIRLILDFVPNHTAMDSALITESANAFVKGTEDDLAREPRAFFRSRAGPFLAHGRDPFFPPWEDTAQVNVASRAGRAVMLAQLQAVAAQCDGVRCDMAMLLLPEVFEKTWEGRLGPAPVTTSFWAEVIPAVRERQPGFLFLAEAYWDREWDLQQQGFDFTYDKVLYDRLRGEDWEGVRRHLKADPAFAFRCARFLENHDEPRAASAFGAIGSLPAAVVTCLAPGLRLLHDGQLEGRRVRVPVQLGRRPPEAVDEHVRAFYRTLLDVLSGGVARDGTFHPLDVGPAGAGDEDWRPLVALGWTAPDAPALVAVANLGDRPARGRVPLGRVGTRPGRTYRLRDRLDGARYERAGEELAGPGLFVALAPHRSHLFELRTD